MSTCECGEIRRVLHVTIALWLCSLNGFAGSSLFWIINFRLHAILALFSLCNALHRILVASIFGERINSVQAGTHSVLEVFFLSSVVVNFPCSTPRWAMNYANCARFVWNFICTKTAFMLSLPALFGSYFLWWHWRRGIVVLWWFDYFFLRHTHKNRIYYPDSAQICK